MNKMRKLLLLLLLILIGCSQEPYVYYHTNGDREEGTYKNGIEKGPYIYYDYSTGDRSYHLTKRNLEEWKRN